MSDKRETALGRWSRLKRTDREGAPQPPPEDRLPETVIPSSPGREDIGGAARDETTTERDDTAAVPELPDIADLNAQSDFSAFLREGVSEDIRRRALRVLWRSDPVLANLDGLNDYDEDFRAAGVFAEAARTAYRVGKGYLDDDKKDAVTKDAVTGVGTEDRAVENAENKVEGGEAAEDVEGPATDAVEVADRSGNNDYAADEREKKHQ